MRNRNLLLFALLVLAVSFAAGCAKRQLTKSEMDRADAVAAKIAKAESMGAKDCAPRELAAAKAELDHARHEAAEHHEKADEYFAAADKAADALLAKTIPCWEAKQPKPAAAPTVTLAANPGTIEKGKCSTLAWSSANATGVSIDRGIGDVGVSGERQVCPPTTITYLATATGAGGTATSSATVTVTQPALPVAEALTFENIYFDFDKSFIRNDAKPILAKVAAYLKKNPGSKLQIEGHCDERGTSEYNMALGQRRADSTKKYLVNLGIAGNRLSTISYGEERPADPGHNEAAWAKNRRAVFVLR
ncbi:MAG TPA: peptidoglycan-associated lipoprotein Pal [Candidatus Deferrimicrobiaceae bacterium]|jgi:peptidoglycan-associated lipoprotein|nr:peptidoglycan-associated lipoprotein Pal [Candidatus Deferrimicrobiaceae bacterium]